MKSINLFSYFSSVFFCFYRVVFLTVTLSRLSCVSIRYSYRSSLAVRQTIQQGLRHVSRRWCMFCQACAIWQVFSEAYPITEVTTDVFLTNGIRRHTQIHQHSSLLRRLSTHFVRTITEISICWIQVRGISPGTADESPLTATGAALRSNYYGIPPLTKGLVKVPHLYPLRSFTMQIPWLFPWL